MVGPNVSVVVVRGRPPPLLSPEARVPRAPLGLLQQGTGGNSLLAYFAGYVTVSCPFAGPRSAGVVKGP